MSGVTAYYQRWERHKRNAQTRPAGYSLHQSPENCKKFAQEFWSRQPERVPEEYIHESGEPFKVSVNGKLMQNLNAQPAGFRINDLRSGEFKILPQQKSKRSKSWKRLPTYKKH